MLAFINLVIKALLVSSKFEQLIILRFGLFIGFLNALMGIVLAWSRWCCRFIVIIKISGFRN